MSKICFKCKVEKALDEFYKHSKMKDGHLNKCKECTIKDEKERRRLYPEKVSEIDRKRNKKPERQIKKNEYSRQHSLRNPTKRSARYLLGNAIRDKRVIRKPCEVCGTTENVQAHHDDYSKPLDVHWLCFKHHRESHGQRVVIEKW